MQVAGIERNSSKCKSVITGAKENNSMKTGHLGKDIHDRTARTGSPGRPGQSGQAIRTLLTGEIGTGQLEHNNYRYGRLDSQDMETRIRQPNRTVRTEYIRTEYQRYGYLFVRHWTKLQTNEAGP
jgi:hypothetical protein